MFVVSDLYVLYIERGQSLFCEMSAIVANCVTDPLRWFCRSLGMFCEKREGILKSPLQLCTEGNNKALFHVRERFVLKKYNLVKK